MCISCLAFSALSLFTPATEALPFIDVQQGTVREITFQADFLKVAQENQVAITMMLNQLPDSPEMLILKEELYQFNVKTNLIQH